MIFKKTILTNKKNIYLTEINTNLQQARGKKLKWTLWGKKMNNSATTWIGRYKKFRTTSPQHLHVISVVLKPPWCHHHSTLPWWVGCRFESQRSSLFLCRRNSRSDPQNLTTVGVGGGNTEARKRAQRGREEDEETWRQRKTLEEDATEEDGYGNFEKWKRNMGSLKNKKI